MRKSFFLLLILVVSENCIAQHDGIGFRLGAPVGMSYKKYISNSTKAIEFGVGGMPRGIQQQYYRSSFGKDKDFDNKDYKNHAVEGNLVLQARFLFHYPLVVEGVEGRFEWYWGAGAFMKIAKVDYTYTDNSSPNVQESKTETDLDLGPEFPLGLEYTFEDIPLTIFTEASLFVEIANRPGIPAFYGGIGLRYNLFGGAL